MVDFREDGPDATGRISRVRVHRTSHKYPFIRTREGIRRHPATGAEEVETTASAVADHLLVQLAIGRTRRDLERVAGRQGWRVGRPLFHGNRFLLHLPDPRTGTFEAALALLARETDVVGAVQPDWLYAPAVVPNDPDYAAQWGLPAISAPDAWNITAGDAGFTVGIVDSGVDYTHPDLVDNMWANPGEIANNGLDDDGNGYVDDVRGWNFYDDTNDPMDFFFHGTHCAGILGARGNNGVGGTGVCWKVSIMALKIFGPLGQLAVESDILDALSYASKMGVTLTSNSYAAMVYSQAFFDELTFLESSGMLFVAAAGNENKDLDDAPRYPAMYPHDNIVSVLATLTSDAKAPFSNYSKVHVDVGAPGAYILSTVPGGGYAAYSGTSMAAPMVAGVCALVWSMDPNKSYAAVKNYVLGWADPVNALSGLCTTEARVNAYTSVLDAQ